MYIAINECYGGFSHALKREWNSPEEFNSKLKELESLTDEEIDEKYNGYDPLSCCKPVLYKLELAEDETFFISEYDGMESIGFKKKSPITSTRKEIIREID